MSTIKSLLLVLLFGAATVPAWSQMIQDPTTWTYEVKKKGGNEYQLIFHLNLKKGWHIWSLKPGGDGYQIAPSFTFANNSKVVKKGDVTEKGKITTTVMEGIKGKVTYLNGKIDYTQTVTVTGSTKITGKLTYQVCDDKMCLPPKDKDFAFDIK